MRPRKLALAAAEDAFFLRCPSSMKGGWERDLGANHGDETPFFKDVNCLFGEHGPSRSVIGKKNDAQSPCR
ncbi:MAG: hypothetical protein CMJ77_03470 [Planctomycetaceae bacterium]|nr:hypothetical protein [Planctomycetaceae bacterium]